MDSLQTIGMKYGTDKATAHFYCDFYEKYLKHIRNESIRLLEIGVWHGASLKMWREYFPKGDVQGLDNWEPAIQEGSPSRVHLVDCESDGVIKFASLNGSWDIIIDDGGHTMKQQQLAFKHLWPTVKSGGFFIIEDLQTCFSGRSKWCNAENIMTTYAMLMALGEGKFLELPSPGAQCSWQDFTTPYFSATDVELIRPSISSIITWTRTPGEYTRSVTSIIKKLDTC